MTERAPLHVIVAMTPRRAIGRAGRIPFHAPEDLKRFKRLTMGHAIIMGRKTFDSIGRALPGRTSIVVTRRDAPLPDGVVRARTIEGALDEARRIDPAPFVIGGGEIYAAALPLATRLHVTLVEGADDAGADAFFPEVDPALFVETAREAGETPGLTFVDYERRVTT